MLLLLGRNQSDSGITPASFAGDGLSLWLDASDASTFTKDGSNLISQWRDKSGSGNHASQSGADTIKPTYNATGLNSLPTVIFASAGGVDRLAVVNSASLAYTALSIYMVCQRDTDSGATQVAMTKYGAGTPTREWQLTVTSADAFNITASTTGAASNVTATSAATATTGTAFLVHMNYNGTQAIIGANNANYAGGAASAIVNSTSDITIGSANGGTSAFQGRISEIIIISRNLSATEHAGLLNYLSDKWDVTITAPVVRDAYGLFGQSNGSGQGLVSELPPELDTTYANVQIFNPTSVSWAALDVGVNQRDDDATKHGPEVTWASAANAIYDAGNNAYLVKHCDGGEHLANEDLTNSFYPVTGTIWQNMVATIGNGMSALWAAGILAEFRYIFWIHGPSDGQSGQQDRADAYETNLGYFITTLRSHLRTYGLARSNLPFVVGKSYWTDTSGYPYLSTIRAAQSAVAASTSAITIIDETPFALGADGLHFNSEGQQDYGDAIAAITLAGVA